MKAWLITWDWSGDHAAVKQPIADILSARLSGRTVRSYVERLYNHHHMTLRERIEFARYNKPRKPPYPAEFMAVGGVPHQGRIICGDNPWLFARIVDDLSLSIDKFGQETVTWKARAFPKLPRALTPL